MSETAQEILAKQVYSEYSISKSNQDYANSEFEAIIDMLECKRTEKNYEWMSDVFIPEYPAILLTESSQWANQYFQSRDFVEIYLESDDPMGQAKCLAAKKLINKTLNRRELYHYQKYMRARTINSTNGFVYAVCDWNQRLKPELKGYREVPVEQGIDEMGNPYLVTRKDPVYEDEPIEDHWNYEVCDPRNVFTSNEYTYSVQDKKYIIIRSEENYESLKTKEKSHGYINLEKIKELIKGANAGRETETSKESYNKDDQYQKIKETGIKEFDVLERYGLMWAVVKQTDEYGNPIEIDEPYDELGILKDKAELIKGIMTIARQGSTNILIRFQPVATIDYNGRPYYPIIRGLCYIHPSKDTGMSDGKYSRELQVAINDTINMSNDRVMLATLPTFKGKRYSIEENDQIFIEPEHVIPLEDPTNDLQELIVRDNIVGALNQASMLTNGLQKVNAVFPTTMGDIPGMASTTATAVAGADSRSNVRANYKSLTFEYTFLTELYWMILQMSYQFMHPKTALNILGPELVQIFDPSEDYTYKPVTSAIEQESSKARKMQMIDQILGRVANIPNPNTPKLVNLLMLKFLELLGSEYNEIKDAMLDDNVPPPQPNMGGANPMGSQPNDVIPAHVSNQNGIEASPDEMSVRGLGGVNAVTR